MTYFHALQLVLRHFALLRRRAEIKRLVAIRNAARMVA